MKALKTVAKAIFPFKFQHQLAAVFFKLNGLFYSGKSVYCDVCESSFAKFLPYKKRAAGQCPGCGSLERHRLLWMFLKNETNFFSNKLRFLHFAPELYFQKKIQAMPNISYTGTDLCSTLAEVHTDIQDMKVFDDNSFDSILCSHVLDHVDNDRKAMEELYRITSPGGWLIVQSSVDINREKTWEDENATTPESRLKIFGQADLARKYGVDIKDRLENAGYKVYAHNYAKDLNNPNPVQKFGVFDDAYIYYCIKSN